MKYKILMYDGHPVNTVLYDRIVLIDQKHETPILIDHNKLIVDIIQATSYKEPWKSQRAKLVRKCDLEEVEFRFTKDV